MISKLNAPSLATIAPTPAQKADASEKAAKVKTVAREFEAILVRQLLSQTKTAGKETMYANMAVDALASSVTAGSGLGLAHQIEAALTLQAAQKK